MNNRMSNLIATLTIIGIVSALVLAFVYQWTNPYIKHHQADARKKAVFQVIPEAKSYKEVKKEGITFYEGFNESGSRVGVAIIEKGPGFQGMIRVMVGANLNQKKINHIKILDHQETPGLGARITGEAYKSNFKDKPFGDYKVVKKSTDDQYKVEAISGATISSTKVTNIVEDAVKKIKSFYGSDS